MYRKMPGCVLVYVVTIAALSSCVDTYKILMPIADITSHVIYAGRLAEALHLRGHDVTILLPSNLKIADGILHTGINIITFFDPEPPIMRREDFKALTYEAAFHPSIFAQLKTMNLALNVSMTTGGYFFKDKQAVEAVQAGSFDFLIVDPAVMSYFLIPYKLNKPYAYLTAECLGPVRRIPIMPSCVPSLMTSYSDDMTFQERVINFLLYALLSFIDLGGYEESRNFVPELPEVGFNDLFLNASLCLQLRENVIDFTRPEMPDVVPVANLMAREAKPLSGDLQSYMDQANNGVILVSFGTVFNVLPSDTIQKLFNAFDTLKQDVIFKYSRPEDLMSLPANVRVMTWVPQNDLLAHPNLRLFITHCGLNSLIETIFHGVPIIGVPHGIDQFNNAALGKSKGFGEVMFLHDFTSDQLQKLITRVITDERYSSAARKLSVVYKDTIKHSNKDPVYWIEHVLKFGDRHLRSHAREMPVYQYLMIDVIAFIAFTTIVVMVALFYTCRCVVTRTCCRPRKSKIE